MEWIRVRKCEGDYQDEWYNWWSRYKYLEAFYWVLFLQFCSFSGHQNAPVLYLGPRYPDVQLGVRVFWLHLPDQCGGDQRRPLHLHSPWHLQVFLSHWYHMVPLWWSGLWVLQSKISRKCTSQSVFGSTLYNSVKNVWSSSFPIFLLSEKRKWSKLKSSHWLLFFRKFHFYVVTKL